jgi:hypothetical protein
VNQQTDAGNNDEHHFAQLIQNKSKWNVEDGVYVDPSTCRRGDVRLNENQTTANEACENGGNRNEAAERFCSPSEQCYRAGRNEG